MIFLAKIVSYLFHPVILFFFMPFLVVYRQTSNSWYAIKWQIFSSVFLFVTIVLMTVATMLGVFSDVDVKHKEERKRFYLLVSCVMIVYLLSAIFFKGIFFPLSLIAASVVVCAGILEIVSQHTRAKVSVHLTTACAFVTSLVILYGIHTLLFSFWIIPLLAWSRIKLKHHSFSEVLIGAFVGTVMTILTFLGAKTLYNGRVW